MKISLIFLFLYLMTGASAWSNSKESKIKKSKLIRQREERARNIQEQKFKANEVLKKEKKKNVPSQKNP